VAEVIRKMGISEQTFYRWKKPGMGVAELRRLKQLEEENRALRDPTLPHHVRHHASRRECLGDQPMPSLVALAPAAPLARDDFHSLDQQ
jgi:hypothetical protein